MPIAASSEGCLASLRMSAIERLALSAMSLDDIDTSIPQDDFDIYQWALPHKRLERSLREFDTAFWGGLREKRLTRRDLQVLQAITGESKCTLPVLANKRLKRFAYDTLSGLVRPLWRAGDGTYRRWFFITLLSDDGNALEYQPAIDAEKVLQKFGRALRPTGLNTIMIPEIQALTNYPGAGYGRSFLFHGNVIGWTDDQDFDAVKCAKALNASLGRTYLGARAAKVVPLTSKGALLHRCYYMLKAPIKAKRIVPTERGRRLADCEIRPDQAVRLMEALSLLTLPNMIKGQRGGVEVVRKLRSAINGKFDGEQPTTKQVQLAWARYWTNFPIARMPFRLHELAGLGDRWIAAAKHVDSIRASTSIYDLDMRL